MKQDEQDIQFMSLIMSLQASAWTMLGKTINPATGKTEKNLEGAKATIDILIMLKEKTKGNLSKAEQDFLSSIVQQLELNYVETKK